MKIPPTLGEPWEQDDWDHHMTNKAERRYLANWLDISGLDNNQAGAVLMENFDNLYNCMNLVSTYDFFLISGWK